MTAWDIGCIVVGSWTIAAVLFAPIIGRAIHTDDEIRQPETRDWLCSDSYYRTEAEATDWVAATPGASAFLVTDDDAGWLDAWTFGEDVPDYIPREWVA